MSTFSNPVKRLWRTMSRWNRPTIRRPRKIQLQVEGLEQRFIPSIVGMNALTNATGTNPQGAAMIEDSNGNLFGTTTGGGLNGNGTLFELSYNAAAKTYGPVTVLANFNYATTGASPQGRLVENAGGDLFGTAISGGQYGLGTIYELPAGSNQIIALASFNGVNGAGPSGDLVQDKSGNLIGTTQNGGPSWTGPGTGNGTVFELRVFSSTITTLASFGGGTNGASPMGGVLADSSGNLFGTTDLGGSANDGTIFEVKKGTGSVTILHQFNLNDGANPLGGLIEDNSGNLYGTTLNGVNVGSVFEWQASQGKLITLASFDGDNGAWPACDLVMDSSGNLFGTTSQGGLAWNPGLNRYGFGTVFEVPGPAAVIYPISAWVVDYLNGSNGSYPEAGLVQDSHGNLFGVTDFGGNGFTGSSTSGLGSVFEEPALPHITPTSLPNWTVNTPGYNQTIMATGGAGSLTFSSPNLPPGLTLNSSTGVLTGTPTTTGAYQFYVQATDSQGRIYNANYTVTINPAPSITTAGLPSGNVGQMYNQAINVTGGTGTITFSSSGTLPPGLTLSAGGVLSGTPAAPGSYQFTVTATDSIGVAANQVYTVTVIGPAARLMFLQQPMNTAIGATIGPVSVEIVDAAGNLVATANNPVTLGIQSGPGTFVPGSITTVNAVNGVATFNNLAVTAPGQYTLNEIVPGQLTGPFSTQFTVANLQVASFASSASGFTVGFNAPILVNSTTPALYGSGTSVNPTVTLTGPNGPVSGSVVVNTATNSLTFVETSTAMIANLYFTNQPLTPTLPDGVYVARISASGLQGLQGLYGGYLSGGHDWTQTFTINTMAAGDDTVWVPPTADGPLQTLNAPGNNTHVNFGGNYPVYLDDTYGNVTSVTFTFNYNPSLLDVTSFTTAQPNSSFTPISFTPGHAVLQYTGTLADAATLKGGPSAVPFVSAPALGYINATVLNGLQAAPVYHGKDLLTLTNISINGGAIPAVAGNALHVVSLVGDADGNGAYSSGDSVALTRNLLGTDSGFAAYPTVDPVVVGDVTGVGYISSTGIMQINGAGVGYFYVPNYVPLPVAGANYTPVSNNVDPALTLPAHLQVGSNRTVTVPVNIDDAHPAGSLGLSEAHLALTYDPKVFTVSAADIHPGSVLTAGTGWTITPSINPVTGQIAIALSSNTPISSATGGSLVTIDFHQIANLPGTAAIALVASVNPTGHQEVYTELEDPVGTFTLSPVPSNSFNPQIDTIVTLATAPATSAASNPLGNLHLPASGTDGAFQALASSTDAGGGMQGSIFADFSEAMLSGHRKADPFAGIDWDQVCNNL